MKVRHRDEDSPSTYRGNGVVTAPGDVVDVDDGTADALLAKRWFEPAPNAPDSGDEPPDESIDVEATADALEDFDEDEWLDQEWQERERRVREGDVDDELLPLLMSVETSENVKEAVDDQLGDRETIELEDVDQLDVDGDGGEVL